jgi:hypothetical protein
MVGWLGSVPAQTLAGVVQSAAGGGRRVMPSVNAKMAQRAVRSCVIWLA